MLNIGKTGIFCKSVTGKVNRKSKVERKDRKSRKIFKNSSSAYRKFHNTTSILLAMRDNITHATSKDKVTMAILADFSKAFDAVAYESALKLHERDFSKSWYW